MKLSKVGSTYGAPLGRRESRTETTYPVRMKLQKVPLNQGGYDPGGAYWGARRWPDVPFLWRAWGDGAEEQQEIFVRAWDREKAKKEVLTAFPNATFYR